MSKTTRDAAIFLLIGAAACFLLLFAVLAVYHSGTVVSSGNVQGSLAVHLALARTLQLFPVIAVFVFVTGFTIFFTLAPFQRESAGYQQFAVPAYTVLLIFMLVTALSEFFFTPALYSKAERIRYRGQAAHQAITRARLLSKEGSPLQAVSVLDTYLAAYPGNTNAQREKNEILKEYKPGQKPLDTASGSQARNTSTQPPETSYQRGIEAYEQENYFEALYYFERAIDLHPDNRELKELYTRTRRKTEESLGSLSPRQREVKELINLKERALGHLEDGEHYQAWSILEDLHRRYPELRDIELYLKQVRGELNKLDFLPEEIEPLTWAPSYRGVLFFDSSGTLDAAGRVIPWQGEWYFLDVSRYRGGRLVATWPYGKWLNGRIRLKTSEEYTQVPSGHEERFFVQPLLQPGFLVAVTGSSFTKTETGRQAETRQLNLYDHIRRGDRLAESGMRLPDQWDYLAGKLGVLFSVYVLSLFTGALAWSKRSIHEFPPPGRLAVYILTIPLLTYFAHLVYVGSNDLLIYLHGYLARGRFSTMNVLVPVLVVNGAAALAATMYFLSRESRVR